MIEVGESAFSRSIKNAAVLELSPRAQRIARIQTAVVERRFVSTEVRLVGHVDYDEYDTSRNRPVRRGQGGRTSGRNVARLGVTLDAYEPDLAWIRLGQPVTMSAEACPGEVIEGTIVFIDSKLDNFTRTIEARVRVPNLDTRLKLGMLVRATVRATLDDQGRVVSPRVGGDWVCPMHANIAKDEFGKCDQCGMDLRDIESLGYRKDDGRAIPPLVIPATAPLITGKRAVVYVADAGSPARFVGRTIVLGPKAADHYLVREGLTEGEHVVVHGNFKIDSALQILAKPSMMSPRTPVAGQLRSEAPQRAVEHKGSIPSSIHVTLEPVMAAYFDVHSALSRDDLASATQSAKRLPSALRALGPPLADVAKGTWTSDHTSLAERAERLSTSTSIGTARADFELISRALIRLVTQFGIAGSEPIYRVHCPMAFDHRGADWIQRGRSVENPYFGSAMFRCGRVTASISGTKTP